MRHTREAIHNPSVIRPHDGRKTKRIDDTVISAIQALDFFIAQADSMRLGTMARILHGAKEDLVYWAVKMDLHETTEEKFINRLLYTNSLFAAADVIAAFTSVENKKKMTRALDKRQSDAPYFSAVKKLRQIV